MTTLPNPFIESTLDPATGVGAATAPDLTDPPVAVAADIPLTELVKRGFDIDRFIADLEPMPMFLVEPSPEYLQAAEMIPMLAVLAGH